MFTIQNQLKEIYDKWCRDGKRWKTLTKKLKNLVNHYQRFNKISYAKCDQIKND